MMEHNPLLSGRSFEPPSEDTSPIGHTEVSFSSQSHRSVSKLTVAKTQCLALANSLALLPDEMFDDFMVQVQQLESLASQLKWSLVTEVDPTLASQSSSGELPSSVAMHDTFTGVFVQVFSRGRS
jgi:hypothetical protein